MMNTSNLISDVENSQEEPTHQPNQRKFEVFCRVRPLQEAEFNQDIVISEDKPTITIYNHTKNTSKVFTFHKIFHQTSTQSQITEDLSNQIYANCRSNGNGCLVLSYGVTNSGKTYTILGTPQQPGLLPILIGKLSQKMPDEKIYISAVQNYIDQFYSLKNKQKLYLKQKDFKFQFQTYQPQQINKHNFSQLITTYINNRNQNGTNANLLSSRSHAIFKIYCSDFYIVIVDLAGSERLQKANSDQQQTIAINNSLFSLGRCIHAFQKGDKVPYRDHKLTQMFVQFFNPNYKIIMIAHINRSGYMFHQNINVLEYAALSTQIKQLNPHKNKSILKSASKVKNFDRSIEKKMHAKDIQNKQVLLENYKYFIKGMNFQFENDLDRHLEQEDRKDRQFLKQLKEGSYFSPAKNQKVQIEKMKIQSRIKFRQMIIQDLAAQRREKMIQCGTFVGSSLRKPYEASIRKRLEEQILKKLSENNGESQQLQRQISQTLQNKEQIIPTKSQPIPSQISQNITSQPEPTQHKTQTPIKTTNKVETESFLKRIIKSPAMYIKSSTSMRMQNMYNCLKQKAQQLVQILGQIVAKPQSIENSVMKQGKKLNQKNTYLQQNKNKNNQQNYITNTQQAEQHQLNQTQTTPLQQHHQHLLQTQNQHILYTQKQNILQQQPSKIIQQQPQNLFQQQQSQNIFQQSQQILEKQQPQNIFQEQSQHIFQQQQSYQKQPQNIFQQSQNIHQQSQTENSLQKQLIQQQNTVKNQLEHQNRIQQQPETKLVSIEENIVDNNYNCQPFGSRQSSIKHNEQTEIENTNLSDIMGVPCKMSSNDRQRQQLNSNLQVKCASTDFRRIQQSNQLLLNGINQSDQKHQNQSLNLQQNNIVTHIKSTSTIIYLNDHKDIHIHDTPSFPENTNLPLLMHQNHYNEIQIPINNNQNHIFNQNLIPIMHQNNIFNQNQQLSLPIKDKQNNNNQINQLGQKSKQIIHHQIKESKFSKNYNSTQDTNYINANKSALKYLAKTQRSLSITKHHYQNNNGSRMNVSHTKSQILCAHVPKSGIKTRNQLRNKVKKEREMLKRKI